MDLVSLDLKCFYETALDLNIRQVMTHENTDFGLLNQKLDGMMGFCGGVNLHWGLFAETGSQDLLLPCLQPAALLVLAKGASHLCSKDYGVPKLQLVTTLFLSQAMGGLLPQGPSSHLSQLNNICTQYPH